MAGRSIEFQSNIQEILLRNMQCSCPSKSEAVDVMFNKRKLKRGRANGGDEQIILSLGINPLLAWPGNYEQGTGRLAHIWPLIGTEYVVHWKVYCGQAIIHSLKN